MPSLAAAGRGPVTFQRTPCAKARGTCSGSGGMGFMAKRVLGLGNKKAARAHGAGRLV